MNKNMPGGANRLGTVVLVSTRLIDALISYNPFYCFMSPSSILYTSLEQFRWTRVPFRTTKRYYEREKKKLKTKIVLLTHNPVYRLVRILRFFFGIIHRTGDTIVVLVLFRWKPIVDDSRFRWFVFELPKFFRPSHRPIEKFVLLSDPVLFFFSLPQRIL